MCSLYRSAHIAQRNKLHTNRGKYSHDDDRSGAAASLGAATLTICVVLQASGERAAIVNAAATFTDDPSGAPTWIQVHVSGHLGWPAGVGYRVIALTPPDAVR
ncbi:MAG: hypothetical protein QOD36_2108 [Mycobacterium sp.]|nr:hypothetical protein [Mycobacterium sp.]